MKFTEYFAARTNELVSLVEEAEAEEVREYHRSIRSVRYANGLLNAAHFFGGFYTNAVLAFLTFNVSITFAMKAQPEVLTGVSFIVVAQVVWAALCCASSQLVEYLNRHVRDNNKLYGTVRIAGQHIEETMNFFHTQAGSEEPELYEEILAAAELYVSHVKSVGQRALSANNHLHQEYIAALDYRPKSLIKK